MPRQKKRPIERQPRLTTHGHRLAGRPADEVPQADHWRTTRRRAAARAGALHLRARKPGCAATNCWRCTGRMSTWTRPASRSTCRSNTPGSTGCGSRRPRRSAGAARSPCPRISLTRASAVAKPVAVVSAARPLALALVIAFVSLAHATPIERASLRVRVSPNLYARQSKPCDPAPGIDEKPGKVSFSVRMRYAPDEREYLVAVSRCCGGPNGD